MWGWATFTFRSNFLPNVTNTCTYLPTHPLTNLTYQYVPTCTYLPTYLSTYLPTHPPTCLPVRLPTSYLPTCLPSYTNLPTYTYLPTYLPIPPTVHVPTYLGSETLRENRPCNNCNKKNELARRTVAKYNSTIIQSNRSTVNVHVYLGAAKSILNPISRKDGEELVKFISQ